MCEKMAVFGSVARFEWRAGGPVRLSLAVDEGSAQQLEGYERRTCAVRIPGQNKVFGILRFHGILRTMGGLYARFSGYPELVSGECLLLARRGCGQWLFDLKFYENKRAVLLKEKAARAHEGAGEKNKKIIL